jgi:hypothetical protein
VPFGDGIERPRIHSLPLHVSAMSPRLRVPRYSDTTVFP